jgi:RimJ/RimL family protein N-acetyltransferase
MRRRPATSAIEGDGFRLRRAAPADAAYLASLASAEDVEPYMSARAARTEDEVRAEIEASLGAPAESGRYVIEIARGDGWDPVGQLAFEVANRRSRIAFLHAVMLDPAVRGRGLAAGAVRLAALHLVHDLGYHRVQLEVYGFNERAQRLFERAGFVREGAKRRAYWRHGAWHDGVMFGLTEEDLAG